MLMPQNLKSKIGESILLKEIGYRRILYPTKERNYKKKF